MTKISQAIQALELGLSEVNADGPFERMRQALAAIREIKPATREEVHRLAPGSIGYSAFRAAERRIFGE